MLNLTIFPTAKQRREMGKSPYKIQKLSLEELAKKIVNAEVLEKVMTTDQDSISITIPYAAYENLDKFVEFCKKYIPYDYNVFRTHDGCGRYEILIVDWSHIDNSLKIEGK